MRATDATLASVAERRATAQERRPDDQRNLGQVDAAPGLGRDGRANAGLTASRLESKDLLSTARAAGWARLEGAIERLDRGLAPSDWLSSEREVRQRSPRRFEPSRLGPGLPRRGLQRINGGGSGGSLSGTIHAEMSNSM